MVRTTVQTPRLNGLPLSAGDFDFTFGADRPFRISWFTVGMFCFVGLPESPKKPLRFLVRGPAFRFLFDAFFFRNRWLGPGLLDLISA